MRDGSGLDIEYRVGAGEELPFADAAFDLVSCCDVLEHVPDLERVIAETARVLRPGGLYLFDTINRTRRSKMLAIKAMQEWRMTRIMDTAIHEWSMFIPPEELEAIVDRHGMDVVEVAGLAPRAGAFTILAALRDCPPRSDQLRRAEPQARFRSREVAGPVVHGIRRAASVNDATGGGSAERPWPAHDAAGSDSVERSRLRARRLVSARRAVRP